jgi:dihydroorotate dehydrogenase
MQSADLSIVVNGMKFENPFVLGSGPPGTNARVIGKSFELGWGGCVIKTISLDASKVINTAPRYAKLRSRETNEVVGFENIELISDRPFDVWIKELRQLKKDYPTKMLIASIMEEYRREAWHEIVKRTQDTGVDGFELNLSCPHGLPERKMGMAMGEDPSICTHPVDPAGAAVRAGADGISLINTILCVTGIDLATLRPLPTVEGHTVPGGYSGQAVRPIALRHVMEVARAFPNIPVSGIGGIETGADAAQFLLLGSSTVQICTGAMLRGYEIIDELKTDLAKIMADHKIEKVADMVGKSLPHFTTHADLVTRQKAAKAERAHGPNRDAETWKGAIAKETEALTTN